MPHTNIGEPGGSPGGNMHGPHRGRRLVDPASSAPLDLWTWLLHFVQMEAAAKLGRNFTKTDIVSWLTAFGKDTLKKKEIIINGSK